MEDGARYRQTFESDLDQLDPQVSMPHYVDTVVDLRDLGRVAVDVVYIGTCTNGHYDDMAAGARILQGRKVAQGVRLLVAPASSEALLPATTDGTLVTLLSAGGRIEAILISYSNPIGFVSDYFTGAAPPDLRLRCGAFTPNGGLLYDLLIRAYFSPFTFYPY